MNEKVHIYVVGAGLMGVDIAAALLTAQYSVTILDADVALAQAAAIKVAKKAAQEHYLEKRLVAANMQASFEQADVVIEAITESLSAKLALLADISARSKPNTPIFSNTSTLSITALSKAVDNAARFAGMHFFYPAHRNRFLEIIQTDITNDETLDIAKAIAANLKKSYVSCPDRPGFIVNAFYLPFINEAITLVDEGLASPAQVDATAKSLFGMAYGPLAVTAMMNEATTRSALMALAEQRACPPVASSAISGQARQFDLTAKAEPLPGPGATAVRSRLLAAILIPTLQILDDSSATPAALDAAALQALQFELSPLRLMAQIGSAETARAIQPQLHRWNMQMPSSINRVGEFVPTQESEN